MSLRDSAIKGVVWTSFGTIGAGLLNFILTMVLARLLAPSDFGMLELLTIFTILSESIIDSGFSQAVIKDQQATQTDLSSVFFFNLAIAIVLYIILFFSSPLIANFYHEPSLVELSRFVFLVIVFHSCCIIQNANFVRNLQFRPQAIASIISVVIAGTVSIFLAFHGYGVWALATNLVLYTFIRMILYWLFSKWRPSFTVSLKSIKKYFTFGVNLLIQGLVDKFISNLESLLVGRVYTKTDLGYFSQARKLDHYITQSSSSVIQKVTYPILAKLQGDNNSLKSGYKRVLGITMFVMMPMLFFTAASADNMLFVFFGPQWELSVPYLRLWSACGLLISFHAIFINIFLVTNNTKKLLHISLIKQAIRLIIIIALIRISVMALMIGIVCVSFISAFMYSFTGGRLIGYSIQEVLKDLSPTFVAASISSIVVFFIGYYLSIHNHYLVFAVQFLVFLLLYLVISKLFKNQSFSELKDIVLSILKSRK